MAVPAAMAAKIGSRCWMIGDKEDDHARQHARRPRRSGCRGARFLGEDNPLSATMKQTAATR